MPSGTAGKGNAFASGGHGDEGEPMPSRCLASLLSVADALLPSLPPPPSAEVNDGGTANTADVDGKERSKEKDDDDDDAGAVATKRFYGHSLLGDPLYADALRLAVTTRIGTEERTKLLLLLYLLSTWWGTALLLGFHPYALYLSFVFRGGFCKWSVEGRGWALVRWRDGFLMQQREIFAGLKRLTCAIALTYVRNDEDEDHGGKARDEGTSPSSAPVPPFRLNPYWEALGYRGPIHRYLTEEEDARLIEESEQYDFRKEGAILDLDEFAAKQGGGERGTSGEEGTATTKATTTEEEEPMIELEYDVVIVGSGAGGGLSASILAGAGYSVLVLEKGPYLSPHERNNLESDMLDKQYEGHALLTTSDGNVMILAGSTLGGGTSVNWACCLETPRHVLTEWFDCHRREEFARSMDAVKRRIGVTATTATTKEGGVAHNGMNSRFVEGCEAAGYECHVSGQNMRDTSPDGAGYTCLGDRYGNKRGGMVTYLADACRSGAKVLPECLADRVLTEHIRASYLDEDGSPQTKGVVRAYGVLAKCRAGGKERALRIRARRCVISSCGALNTPCLLLRSKFGNRHIGRHLRLHPVTPVLGRYGPENEVGEKKARERGSKADDNALRSPMEGSVNGYLGAPMTAVSDQFQHGPDDSGYGAKLECPSCHAGLNSAALPWMGPREFREKLLMWKDSVLLIVLQRDRGEGRVTLKKGDAFSPRVEYKLDKRDRKSMLEALVGAVRVLVASGAEYVATSHYDDGLRLEKKTSTSPRADDDGPEVKRFIDRLRTLSWDPFRVGVFSAHQMGTCRMGPSPSESACDPDGELWDCDDLYVFDTSLFPTASGSNPMLSVLALTHMLCGRLALRLKYEDSKLAAGGGSKDDGGKKAAEAMEAEDMMRVREERRRMGMDHGPPREMPEWLETILRVAMWCVAAVVLAAAIWDFWIEIEEELAAGEL